MELIDQLNAHKWLYLDRLYEKADLELCILVDEAQIVGGELETFDNAIAYGPIVTLCATYFLFANVQEV